MNCLMLLHEVLLIDFDIYRSNLATRRLCTAGEQLLLLELFLINFPPRSLEDCLSVDRDLDLPTMMIGFDAD